MQNWHSLCRIRHNWKAVGQDGKLGIRGVAERSALRTMAVERKYERDIDLLLAEEFAVSPAFATWFLAQTRFADLQAHVVDIYVSESVAVGESDLVVVFEERGTSRRIAFLIDASFQPNQGLRYVERARNESKRGDYHAFEVVLCAPAAYIANMTANTEGFDSRMTYEAIAGFLKSSDEGLRSQYRANFVATAAQRNANTWTRTIDETTNAFWAAAYLVACKDFPSLELKPLSLTKDSSWIVVRPSDLPTSSVWTYVALKGTHGFADLTFNRTVPTRLADATSRVLEAGMTLE